MRNVSGSKKVPWHVLLAVIVAVGATLSFSYAFAAERTDGSASAAPEAVPADTALALSDGAPTSAQDEGSAAADDETSALDSAGLEVGGASAAVAPTVELVDHVASDGTYGAVVTGTVPDGARYVWQRSADGENWVDVVATKVTGDSYNVDPDATKATSINIALDSEAIGDNATDTVLYSYRVQLKDANDKVLAQSGPVKNPYYTQLQNGGFESPDCSNNTHVFNNLKNGTEGLIWQTTASDGVIEIGNSSDKYFKHSDGALNTVYGTTAKEGNQFAELNANRAGALYQDVMTVPNSTLYWSLYHRARSKHIDGKETVTNTGPDTMYVLIMPTSYAQNNVTTQEQVNALVAKVLKDPDSYKNNGIQVTEITDDTADWYYHTGNYAVPEGQYLTRYFFAAGDTNTGNPTIGNFLDGVSFSTHVPAPTPDTGNLTISKVVAGGAANTSTEFTFKVACDDLKGKSIGGMDFDADGVATFKLHHGESKTIVGIPSGLKVSVSETDLANVAGTSTTVSVNKEGDKTLEYRPDEGSNTLSTVPTEVVVTANDTQELDFTNNAQLVPDTGVDLDASPAAVCLGVVAAGAAVLGGMAYRRMHGERGEW